MPAFDSTVRLRQLNQPELSGYIVLVAGGIPSSTGTLTGVFYPYKTNPSGYITTGQTGSFITQSALDSNYYSTLGYVASNYYPLSNPYGYITSQSLTGNAVWTTGDQNISGAKNFYIRPSVNGSGVFLQGESLITNAVYTTGDQTIAGNKTFTGISYFNSGAFSNRPTVNGTGVLLSGEASSVTISNVVYQTGNQTISGIKTFTGVSLFNGGSFSNRPTVNGTGVLLSGEASSVTISDVVYQTGNQTISGNKTFTGISYFKSGAFSSSLTISGVSVSTGVSTGSFVTTGQTGKFITTGQTGDANTLGGKSGSYYLNYANITGVSGVVYTTGNQTISGVKTFKNNLITNYIGSEAANSLFLYSDTNGLYFSSNAMPGGSLSFGLAAINQTFAAEDSLTISAGLNGTYGDLTINAGGLVNNYIKLLGGKVGINSNYSPTYTLDVDGSGNFKSGLYVNGIPALTSVITGNVLLQNGYLTTPNGGLGKLSNILGNSSKMANNTSYWSAFGYPEGISALENSTEVAAPDGTFTAIKSLGIAINDPLLQSGILAVSNKTNPALSLGTPYVLSCWLKNTGSPISNIFFGINDQNITGFSLPTLDWTRYVYKITGLVTSTARGLQTYTQESGKTYFVWGPQLEIGSGDPGPYVGTTTIGINSGRGLVYNGDLYSGDQNMNLYWTSTGYVANVSGYLKGLISSSSAGVNSLNVGGTLVSGAVILSGINGVSISTGTSNTIYFSGQSGNFVTTGQTGSFVTTGQTGVFVTTGQTGSFVTTGQTGVFALSSQVVYTTGNQTISGIKTFTGVSLFNGGSFSNRPTVNGTGVLLSGEASSATVSNVVYTTGNGTTQTISGSLTVTGHFSANTKSFLIDHPTIPGKKLQYGSLESPYHGIRLTAKNKVKNGLCQVKLPEYIKGLIHQEEVNIQITNINHDKILYVKDIDINNNYFIIGCNNEFDFREYEFYWSFTAVRKDVDPLIVEY